MQTRFIAEVASNHNRNLDRSMRFVEEAARMGCYGVKFQLFRIRKLFDANVLSRSQGHRRREAWELPGEFLPLLSEKCRREGILFGCTPFDLEAVEELRPHVDFYKISSYDILREDLLAACASASKPLILSTGMATLDEVEGAVAVLRKNGCKDFTLLHCVSSYPAAPKDCNLAAIELLRKKFQCPVGWSDHSANPGVILRAVHRWQAAVVEFHLDLDGKGEEYGIGHCWLPDEIERVIQNVMTGLEADGREEKIASMEELQERSWRADPEDGLRPLKAMRQLWRGRCEQ